MDLHAGQGGVLIDDGPDASVAKRPSLADEDFLRGNWGPGFQVGLDGRRAGSGSGTDLCFPPFPNRKTTEPLRSPITRSSTPGPQDR